jgi:hypothetical protein
MFGSCLTISNLSVSHMFQKRSPSNFNGLVTRSPRNPWLSQTLRSTTDRSIGTAGQQQVCLYMLANMQHLYPTPCLL